MTDSLEIHNLFSGNNHGSDNPKNSYSKAEWLWFADQNNGSYNSGQIRLDTQLSQNQFVVWSESYLAIPLTIRSTSTNYNELDPISFKSSALNLITQVSVQTAAGNTLVPQATVNVSNQIRKFIEASDTAPQSSLFDCQLHKATNPGLVAGTGPTSGWYYSQATSYTAKPYASNQAENFITLGNSASTGTILSQNSFYNQGFDLGIQQMKSNSVYYANGGENSYFETTVWLKLGDLHDFFKCLDEPLLGLRFFLQFTTPITGTPTNMPTSGLTSSVPIMVGDKNISGAAMSSPSIGIGNSVMSTTRIYYKSVKFEPEVNKSYSEKLSKGFKKTIRYLQPDTYMNISGKTNWTITTPTTYTDVNVITTTIRPRRIFMVMFPTGYDGSITIPFVGIGRITQGNLLVNNVPYYSTNLVLDQEFWRILAEQMPNCGDKDQETSLLGYGDFLTNYRIYCFDITRINEITLENQGVNLSPQYMRTDTNQAVDLVYVVERENIVEINFTTAEVKAVLL